MKSAQALTGKLSRAEAAAVVLIPVVYAVGFAGFALQPEGGSFMRLTPIVLLLSLVVSLAFHDSGFGWRTVLVFSIIAAGTWFIEAAGVSTGLIFGSYSYHDSLGPGFLDTPLIIGINWLLLVYGSAALAVIWGLTGNARVIVAALLMVLYDIVLEQVAPSMQMWEFEGGNAPLQNYIAWFIIASAAQLLVKNAGIRISNRIAAFIFVVQLVFFLLVLTFIHLTA